MKQLSAVVPGANDLTSVVTAALLGCCNDPRATTTKGGHAPASRSQHRQSPARAWMHVAGQDETRQNKTRAQRSQVSDEHIAIRACRARQARANYILCRE